MVLIMDQQARVMYVAARPVSSFLKWHMKIILIWLKEISHKINKPDLIKFLCPNNLNFPFDPQKENKTEQKKKQQQTLSTQRFNHACQVLRCSLNSMCLEISVYSFLFF